MSRISPTKLGYGAAWRRHYEYSLTKAEVSKVHQLDHGKGAIIEAKLHEHGKLLDGKTVQDSYTTESTIAYKLENHNGAWLIVDSRLMDA